MAPFQLQPHGRYSHTEAYVARSLRDAALVILDVTAAELRKELGRPVPGLVVTAVNRQ